MKRINLFFSLAIVLVSCSSPQWVKPGATPEDLDRDTVSCNDDIVTSSIGARAVTGMGASTARGRTVITGGARADAAKVLEQCLQGKGWTRQKTE